MSTLPTHFMDMRSYMMDLYVHFQGPMNYKANIDSTSIRFARLQV